MPKFARPTSYTGRQATEQQTGDSRFATQAEANAGTSDELAISPATLAGAAAVLTPPATTTTFGTVKLTDNNEPVATKFYADNLAIAGAPAWSETVSGIGQLSTLAEAVAGTDDNTAITPLKLAGVLAAGGSASFNGGAVTDFIGTGVLTAGTQTIANTNIATGDVILLTRTGVAASTALGELTYTISNGASFTVTSIIIGTPASTQTADVSTYAYFIVRPT